MPPLATVKAYVDGKLADLWTLADARQLTYAATRGRYWQGRITLDLASLPPSLVAAPQTAEYNTPDDDVIGIAGSHELGWRGAMPTLPAKLAAAFRADEWLSPAGIGWRLTCWIKVNGTLYTRSRAHMEDGSIVTEPWSVVP